MEPTNEDEEVELRSTDILENLFHATYECHACGNKGKSQGIKELKTAWMVCPDCGHVFPIENKLTWN